MNAVTTVLLIRMRRIVHAFREANATAPARAIVPSAYNIRQDFAFRRLVQRGVLIAVTAQRYYLNEQAETRYRKQRQTAVLVVAVLLVVILIIIGLTSR